MAAFKIDDKDDDFFAAMVERTLRVQTTAAIMPGMAAFEIRRTTISSPPRWRGRGKYYINLEIPFKKKMTSGRRESGAPSVLSYTPPLHY
jgi:hypothetical protein